jgi:hypothetical protein
MDMSFAIQALSCEFIAENHKKLEPGVIAVPKEIDHDVAFRKLEACGLTIDKLTPDQAKFGIHPYLLYQWYLSKVNRLIGNSRLFNSKHISLYKQQ